MKEEEGNNIDIDFGINSATLKTKYLDLYEDVYTDMVYTNRFDENSDLSTTYLGQTKMTTDTKIKAEESFLSLDKASYQKNYWMELAVRFC